MRLSATLMILATILISGSYASTIVSDCFCLCKDGSKCQQDIITKASDKEVLAARTDVSCHCDLVSGKCPKNFQVSGKCDVGSGRAGFNPIEFLYPTSGYVNNPILTSYDLNNFWQKLDHLIWFGTLEKK